MESASTVYIARHGERIDHVNPKWTETAENPYDPFLTEKGIQQAQALGRFLLQQTDNNITHIFASPFYRTVQTANEVAKLTNLPICIEPGLGEYLNKDWFSTRPKLVPIEHLKKEFGCIDTSYTPHIACRYPESRDDVIVRSCMTARVLAEKFSGNLLLVGHGMTCEFMARGLSNAGIRPYISYCSVQTCRAREEQPGVYDLDEEVRIDFMDESIRPVVKKIPRSYQ